MNVVSSGGMYQIYGESVKTGTCLPPNTYEVNFSKQVGFFLTAHNDLSVNEEKVYGTHESKVNKILRGFEASDRNFGVILSGAKGIGKSLFARILANKAREKGIPLIIVPDYVPGIASFISSIEQEVIVLFDEFEKTFGKNDKFDPQEEMLSLFDGIDNGKKLFMITCNEVHKLNQYLLNRPGRFHYHFILTNPTSEEVREYMTDKLLPEYQKNVDAVVNFSQLAEVTYDVLRAIVFELNQGYSLKETLQDLNINKEGTPRYLITVKFTDGNSYTATETFDLYRDWDYRVWFYGIKGRNDYQDAFQLTFAPSSVETSIDLGCLTIDPGKVSVYIDDDYFDTEKPEEMKKLEYCQNREIESITLVKLPSSNNYKYTV